ncbi:hypothetical protein BGHDH14_bgh00294 [Blumeria hordei DH14]|uniref:2,5-diamino-6-ribosylamino-4(3H)-pyrimidinone 5'-phosphate reductase n=1 Tax=Blumeria graminis f. sp. hordei (strain DH14) TaxID=546991 RepID=N1J868_BLUG1|nr:hypothetical protein BGHDH14_bgh00294 [Blumeria hordei DH14]
MENSLHLSPSYIASLDPYMPSSAARKSCPRTTPHVTLTYASSLDSRVALAPGLQTVLSGPETKAMTHYLRARHDAILVGATTALIDNPRLNSRWEGAGGGLASQPRPIILDPSGRWLAQWDGQENLSRLVREGKGLAPFVVVDAAIALDFERLARFTGQGGQLLSISGYKGSSEGVDWMTILSKLNELGIKSLMVEGGATVINDILKQKNRHLLTSVIMTIAPIFMGAGGVTVSPTTENECEPVCRLENVTWLPMGKDAVMAALM